MERKIFFIATVIFIPTSLVFAQCKTSVKFTESLQVYKNLVSKDVIKDAYNLDKLKLELQIEEVALETVKK